MKKIILLITGFLLLLSSCDNFVDLSDMGTVSIRMAGSENSRYIAGGGDTVEEAVLGFVEQDVMYNFQFVEEITDFNGEYLFTGIPVGDYSFLAMLMGNDKIVSMAIQGVTIEAGNNDLVIDMGPGFNFEINNLEFDMGDLSSNFTLSLRGNEVTIGISSELIIDNQITLDISSNTYLLEFIDSDGVTRLSEEPEVMPSDLTFNDYIFNFDITQDQEFTLKLKSFDDSINEYVMIFKEM